MNALSTLINRLSELAATAPHEYRSRLNRQVAALRAGFKKQQERCIAFLQLTNEYADRFLSDISEEIQQQSSFLDALEKRLDMAKTLRQEAIHMRKSYKDGTLECIKKVRRTGVYP
jgi:division protein CdvB (Snf7/Vps24/ESCRT-III family)